MDKGSNRVQRVDVREVGRDLGSFLGEEEKEEDRGAKRAGCSPWKKADTVALDGTVGTVAADDTVVVADKGAVDRGGRVEDRVVVAALKGIIGES